MISIRKIGAKSISNRSGIQNKESDEVTVYLYSMIGGWSGINHEEWIKDFNEIKASTIHLRIDSDGGDVFAARAMKTAIMQHKSKVIAHIDGLAASAASFLMLGANEVEIVDGGFIMIHNAISILDILGYFNIDDLTDLIEELTKEQSLHEKINESIAKDYQKKTGKEIDQISAWMNEETWFTAQEALENGFADKIYDGEPIKGSYDLSTFHNVPEALRDCNTNVTKRIIEKALRDVGLSSKAAKAILAEGYKDDQRDADELESEVVDESQRDVEDEDQRDVEENDETINQDLQNADPIKPDRTADLLRRANFIRIQEVQ